MNDISPTDASPNGLLARLGDLLLDIYRLSDSEDAETFQEAAMSAAKRVVGFDSAIWGSGIVAAVPIVHTMYLFRQPDEMMQSWERIKHLDMLNAEVLRRPGTTVVASAEGFDADRRFPPEGVAHCRRFGMEYQMSTVFPEPLTGLVSAISFYRSDTGVPFSEADRLLKQCLMPHLAATWSMVRLRSIERQQRCEPASNRPLALCDHFGLLHACNPQFVAHMRAEWANWRGPALPTEIQERLGSPFVGRHIVAGSDSFNDLWWLYTREKSPIDDLSRRELEVARLFAEGQSYQKIAESLHRSPSTVRNHLKNVYAKLGVSNKVALGEMLHWRTR